MNKSLKLSFLLIGHFILIVVVYWLFYLGGITDQIPNETNLKNWDASWYQSILKSGYNYTEGVQSNTGFFPGFPYLWKLFAGKAIIISLVNFGLFSFGLIVLAKSILTDIKKILIVLAIPSLMFFYVPYTESLSYLLGVWAIISFDKKDWNSFYISLLLMCLVRPQIFFLVPAVLSVFLFDYKASFNWKKLVLSMLALIGGTLLSFALIGWESGELMAYSKSQIGNWNHQFGWPQFPLTTWRGYRVLWNDGLALFIAVGMFVYVAQKVILKLTAKLNQKVDKTVLLSSVSLAMTLVFVLFFHPEEEGRTSILSLNRYVFCSPFLHFLLLKKVQSQDMLRRKHLFTFGGIAFITALMLGLFYGGVVELNARDSQLFLIGLLMLCASSLILLKRMKESSLNTAVLVAVYLVGLLLQVYLFQSFIKGNWIG